MRFVYTLLFYALTPLAFLRMASKSRREPGYSRRWPERLGFYGELPKLEGAFWFHAVSVGEAEAAFPLIRALSQRLPGVPVLVTTTTPTGSARVKAVLGEAVSHVYLPYDLPDAVRRFLSHFRPRLAIVMETEIWPNLFHASAQHGIPVCIVNARLSEKSAKGYAKIGGFTRQTLNHVRWIAAQTQADAERFVRVGARAETVTVAGNIKYDVELPADYFQQAKALRESLFGSRPVWIAASTHQGEESELLKVLASLLPRHPGLLLVLVPRHPPRFDSVASQCQQAGWRLARRSLGQTAEQADVYLVDTLGELRLFYATADVAFVGGSLVAVGGHNVLEAAIAGVPVLFGPQMFNFQEVASRLLAAGGAVQVNNAEELTQPISELLNNPGKRQSVGEQARQFVEASRGALGRVLEGLLALSAKPGT